MSRKSISASVRWSIFARDGFTCRYCGATAGEQGVSLAVDHVVSVKDGGTNAMDNLVTACQKCNGGKGARSMPNAPASEEAVNRTRQKAESMATLSASIQESIASRKQLEQDVVNIKCSAYCLTSVQLAANEATTAIKLLFEFGGPAVSEWYECAAAANVHELAAIRYVCGCARNARAENQTTRQGEQG